MILHQSHPVIEWIVNCVIRFKNMDQVGIDTEGIKRLQPIVTRCLEISNDDFIVKDQLTVGEFDYLARRADSNLSKYNTHKNYHEEYGNMGMPPYAAILETGIVNWATGVCQDDLRTRIEDTTGFTIKGRKIKRLPTNLDNFKSLFERPGDKK